MRLLLLAVCVAALLASACSPPAKIPESALRGFAVPDPPQVPDFELVDQDGQLFRLSDQRGRVVVLFFGYAHCPDVCPVTLSTWSRVHEALADQADAVRFAFVTVDPQRDTPEKLAQHMELFDPSFSGLWGSEEQLGWVYQNLGVYHKRVDVPGSAAAYVMDHTTRMYVIDALGRLRVTIPFDSPMDDVVHDIRWLLNESESVP